MILSKIVDGRLHNCQVSSCKLMRNIKVIKNILNLSQSFNDPVTQIVDWFIVYTTLDFIRASGKPNSNGSNKMEMIYCNLLKANQYLRSNE